MAVTVITDRDYVRITMTDGKSYALQGTLSVLKKDSLWINVLKNGKKLWYDANGNLTKTTIITKKLHLSKLISTPSNVALITYEHNGSVWATYNTGSTGYNKYVDVTEDAESDTYVGKLEYSGASTKNVPSSGRNIIFKKSANSTAATMQGYITPVSSTDILCVIENQTVAAVKNVVDYPANAQIILAQFSDTSGNVYDEVTYNGYAYCSKITQSGSSVNVQMSTANDKEIDDGN